MRRMPLPAVTTVASLFSDQSHRKIARQLTAHIDEHYYLKAYPDVQIAGIDPAFHYVKYGWREGRDPSPSFSTSAYLAEHPELLQDQKNPLLHFLENAPIEEGASPRNAAEIQLIATELDAVFYRKRYAIPADVDPTTHYCRDGWRAGLDPSPKFSTSHYLLSNLDVRNSGVNPYWHYLAAGRAEGRSPKPQGGWRYELLARQRPLAQMKEDWVRREAPPRLLSARKLAECLEDACAADHVLISIGHDDYRSSAGGVQLCMALEARSARRRSVDYLSIYPWQSWPTLSSDTSDPVIAIVANGALLGHARSSDLVAAGKLVTLPDPHLVIHHLMGHRVEHFIEFAQAIGQNEAHFWLHDNFSLCTNYALQRNDVAFCDAPSPQSNACGICVYGQDRQRHLERMEQLFGSLGIHVIAPSKVALDYWKSRTGLSPKSSRVHPHLRLRRRAAPYSGTPAQEVRIAFVGLPAPHKGWPVFQQLQSELSGDDRYAFWHFSSELSAPEMHHVPIHSSADTPDAMVEALRAHQIDIVIHWATCRETFSLSTHEAIAAGAFVVTHGGSGNVAAVVRRQKAGIVLEDEAALSAWVAEGGLLSLADAARSRRSQYRTSFKYSDFTLDLLALEGRS